jgi:hypothetical protein
VDCGAGVAGKRLPAIKRFYVPHPPVVTRQVVVCSWKIPRGAAGETLYPDDADNAQYGSTYQGLGTLGTFAWTVKKR